MYTNTGSFSKTRIAPTPSGYLHLGNVLSFAITALLARKYNARILLRIDDLDQARVNKAYVQDIFATLSFLDIPWDEGPRNLKEFEEHFSQLHRMAMYRDALNQLAAEGLVFACNCSRGRLNAGNTCACSDKNIPLSAENINWRLSTENHTGLAIKNYKGDFIKAILPAQMKNFVVRKKDGFPAYQLTSVIDDLFFGTDLIVRGEDLWASTVAQHLLAGMLRKEKFNSITFYHHALLVNKGEKLSKSAGATSVRFLRENGNKPAHIFTAAAAMLGYRQEIKDWEQLARLVITEEKR